MWLQKKKKKAFTLAEVLITLGIIGVVAAITIPILMQNYQNQQYVVDLQKTYTTINQALIGIANDYGCPGDLACTGLFDPNTSLQNFGDAVASYFKVGQNCQLNTGQGCGPSSVKINFDGSGTPSTSGDSASDFYRFVTLNNISIRMQSGNNNCGSSFGTNSMSAVCGVAYIDVNGPQKGPNYYGRDIFYFYITNGKGPLLYPYGGKDHINTGTSYYWKDQNACTSGDPRGTFCAGRVIDEQWQMKY